MFSTAMIFLPAAHDAIQVAFCGCLDLRVKRSGRESDLPAHSFQGVEITGILEGKPAALAGIEEGTIITSVNGVETLEVDKFVHEMSVVSPGDTVEFGTSSGTYTVAMQEDPQVKGKAHMGVFLEQVSDATPEAEEKYGFLIPVMLWFYGLFLWIAQLNLMIGILNFLPIWILDGGRIFHDLLGYVVKKKQILYFMLNLLFMFVTLLLLFNLIGPFLKNLFFVF